jgi:hypothetical protein
MYHYFPKNSLLKLHQIVKLNCFCETCKLALEPFKLSTAASLINSCLIPYFMYPMFIIECTVIFHENSFLKLYQIVNLDCFCETCKLALEPFKLSTAASLINSFAPFVNIIPPPLPLYKQPL